MKQIDPSVSPNTSSPSAVPPSQPQEPRSNWRVSVAMVVGLAILFATLFGLRALHIFPSEPGQDAEIVAARATQAVLGTQQALAPRPTVVTTSAAVAAPTGAPATALPTPVAQATVARIPAAATQPGTGQQPAPTAAQAAQSSVTAAVATTQPAVATPQATTAPAQLNPTDVQLEATPVQAAVPADLAAAIVQGYSNYWTVRVSAMRDPGDTTIDLGSVMAGTELAVAQKTMGDYRDRGEAYSTKVSHQIWITGATTSEATLVDQFTATSQAVDPSTAEPISDSQPIVEHRRDTFLLNNIAGVWKVVDEPSEE